MRVSHSEALQQAATFVDDTVIPKSQNRYPNSKTEVTPEQRWVLIEKVAVFLLAENGQNLDEQYAIWKHGAIEILEGKADTYRNPPMNCDAEWMDGFNEAIGHLKGLRLP